MEKPNDIRDMERRAQRYWTTDGLPELVMGALWIVWGGASLIGESLPKGTVANLYWTFTPLFLVLSGLGAVSMTKRLKAAITFPRAGYVSWKEPTRQQRLVGAGVAMIVGIAITIVAARGGAWNLEKMAPVAVGAVLGLGFAVASITQRAPHLLLLAAAALLLAPLVSVWKTGYDALNWLLIALGAMTMVLGVARLWWFLRHHPVAQPA